MSAKHKVNAELLVLGNWKMHLTHHVALELVKQVGASTPEETNKVQVGVCPPFPYLLPVANDIYGTSLLLGAQDCHHRPEGAYTGDVSAVMLNDAGCHFALVGHSERRTQHKETDAEVRSKAQAAVDAGLHTVICVGETFEERESGIYSEVLTRQVMASLPENASRSMVSIAYEPIWAIGTGKTASADDIAAAHGMIRAIAEDIFDGELPRILYGGSVKANNALDILSLPVVDGVLVGGASLDASQFAEIIRAAEKAAS